MSYQSFRLLLFRLPLITVLATSQLLGGCASMMSAATQRMADNLSDSILNHNDLKTVENGAPAYLLMVDSFIEATPDNTDMLLSGARLYSAYSGIFVKEKERSQRLADRALNYALQATCKSNPAACPIRNMPFADLQQLIASLQSDDLEIYFTLGTTWASWVLAHSSDWGAVADLARIKLIMQRVIKLDDNYENGAAHLYMGVLSTLLPPALGGKPDIGKHHFEQAINLSQGKNLMAKVMYAEKYARLIFDKELHNKLLQDVLQADPSFPGLTLMNTLAQKQAKALLATADEYF